MQESILIVDDNKTARAAIRNYLKQADDDLIIDEAASGEEALRKIKSNQYECVYLDYVMNDMTGLDVLKELYCPDNDLTPAPIVMITAHGNERVVMDAIRWGAHDYIIKNTVNTDTLLIAKAKAQQVYILKLGRMQAKRQLEQSQKMEAFGRLAGGIAHDFNNLLTIIMGHVTLLENEVASQGHNDTFERINKALKRGTDLVKRLMLFSRYRKLEPECHSANTIIHDLNEMLSRTLGQSIIIDTDLRSTNDMIYVDAGQLELAIINMCVNSKDAMPDGGTLHIRTKDITLNKTEAGSIGLSAGEYITIEIEDTGMGIPEKIRASIFEPFFTTKDPGQGTGLGLSMVYSFIKESGGTIHCQSQKNNGTCFTMHIPKARQSSRTDDNVIELQTVIERCKALTPQTILIVEDEEEIAFLISHALTQSGHKCLIAANAEQALKIFMDQIDNIAVLLSDIALPGDMNGIQLAGRIEALNPDIKLVFTTGFADNAVPDMNLARQYTVITKPYNADELAQRISRIIEQDAQENVTARSEKSIVQNDLKASE